VPVLGLPINVDKKSVFRYLGYIGERQSCPQIEEEINKVVKEAKELVLAKICYDYFNFIFEEGTNTIVFSQGVFFSDKDIVDELKSADNVVIAIMTLGDEMDKKILDLFSDNNYLKGMIYNAIGNCALDNLRKDFRAILEKQLRGSDRGITSGFSPGNSGWSIANQRIIFRLLDARSIGVGLNEFMMMNPTKSISVVYGVGKAYCHDEPDGDCSKCNLRNCQFRLSS